MFVLKAFATNSVFIDNTHNAVSAIGEITTQSLTYARDKGFYKSSLAQNIDIVAFTSRLDGTPYILNQNLVDDIVKISDFIYNAAITAGTELFADVLLNSLLTTFPTIINNVASGNIVSDGNVEIPEWVSWTIINDAAIGTENEIKIWFVDSSFQLQYDEYEIVVIPPMEPLNNFFLSTIDVITFLDSQIPTTVMERIQLAKADYPESIIAARQFDFVDPTTPGNLIPTTWYLLIYGAAGDNIDVIKNKLITYILANSTFNQAQWTNIFPTIFKTTEFVIIPSWNRYSIPNMTLQAGIYSPGITISEALNLLLSTIVNYPVIHIENNADVFSQPYKALTLLSVGSPDNTNNIFNITNMFPDFIDIPSTSMDFARMSQRTQDWAILLARMILIAETLTVFSSVPSDMSKVVRNDILYIVSKFENINYLVASKKSF